MLRQQAEPVVEVPSPISGGPVPCNEMTVDGLQDAVMLVRGVLRSATGTPLTASRAAAWWPYGHKGSARLVALGYSY